MAGAQREKSVRSCDHSSVTGSLSPRQTPSRIAREGARPENVGVPGLPAPHLHSRLLHPRRPELRPVRALDPLPHPAPSLHFSGPTRTSRGFFLKMTEALSEGPSALTQPQAPVCLKDAASELLQRKPPALRVECASLAQFPASSVQRPASMLLPPEQPLKRAAPLGPKGPLGTSGL